MATLVQIYNAALGLIGAAPCTAVDDGTAGANACNRMYEMVRDAALARVNWDFATKQSQLSKSATTPTFGYLYQYALPSDFVAAIKLSDNADGFQWEIKQGFLCIDLDSAGGEGYEVELEYVCRVEDPTYYPAAFCKALAFGLASMVASVLLGTRGVEVSQAMDQKYEYAIAEAAAVSARNERKDYPGTTAANDSTWLSARSV